ncbi:IclR family transcriptional regulator [Pseudomonas sp. SST3]|jgi:IclR family acetate operon transcriptional repressor|uniref:IclR family transcriptional regulator n=1 Tax=Pseudomonas sp. SST3 TaxID=2267882 RepID=UPI000E044C46|nr:IclR family transcriptional regulator [Pseudomonas sp. SST3]NKQ12736.1 IclR family transcriptional regulator [Pseudomonas sp. SST3]
MATPFNLSVIKAFKILSAFQVEGEKLTLSQLTRRLDMNIATVHRFLVTLESVGAIVRTIDGAFELGLLLAELGGRVSIMDVMHNAFEPHVNALAETFGETIHGGILDNGTVCYVAKGEGYRSLTITTHIGKRLPSYCTGLGKALMSMLDREELERCIGLQSFERHTNKTTTDRTELLREIELVRARGYALDDEQVEMGLRCVAVPISCPGIRVKSAISLSAPTTRLDQKKIKEVADALKEHAQQIAITLSAAP